MEKTKSSRSSGENVVLECDMMKPVCNRTPYLGGRGDVRSDNEEVKKCGQWEGVEIYGKLLVVCRCLFWGSGVCGEVCLLPATKDCDTKVNSPPNPNCGALYALHLVLSCL